MTSSLFVQYNLISRLKVPLSRTLSFVSYFGLFSGISMSNAKYDLKIMFVKLFNDFRAKTLIYF
jgi:hypothetical protein